MPKLSTPERLLLFAYNETSLEENLAIIDKVQSCPRAQDTLDGIYSAMALLEGIKKGPSQKTIDHILSLA